MAEFVDNFSDSEELGVDPKLTELDENFERASNHLPRLVSNLSEETLLTLYAYYKQGKEGICNIAKPSWFDFKGRAKWEAWKNLGDMTKDNAKALYIDAICEIDPSFQLNSKKESWVSVSTLYHEDNIEKQEKDIYDYVKQNDRDMVLNCLKRLKSGEINKLDDTGLSLLHWASDRGHVEIISDLLSHGADINLKDSEGLTALHYSASCGHIDCVRLLLEKGALQNIQDNDGSLPADVASDDDIKLILACS